VKPPTTVAAAPLALHDVNRVWPLVADIFRARNQLPPPPMAVALAAAGASATTPVHTCAASNAGAGVGGGTGGAGAAAENVGGLQSTAIMNFTTPSPATQAISPSLGATAAASAVGPTPGGAGGAAPPLLSLNAAGGPLGVAAEVNEVVAARCAQLETLLAPLDDANETCRVVRAMLSL
jgi:hypothetical protein